MKQKKNYEVFFLFKLILLIILKFIFQLVDQIKKFEINCTEEKGNLKYLLYIVQMNRINFICDEIFKATFFF